jgi:glycosyltransferase involved in cell wall biosynthesis
VQISVVIPAYNCASYIEVAIQSALTQLGCEVIVVDDGSTDHTARVVNALICSGLRYVYQPNQGVSVARNHGIRLAKGQFIAFLDADDWFLPGKLVQQADLLMGNSNLGLVQSGWQRVDEQGRVLREIKPWEKTPQLTLETWLRFKPVLPSALMIRRDWLEKVGGFDSELEAAEDVDLVCRLALAGCEAAWLPQIGVNYRLRSQSAMGSAFTQARDLNRFLDKFFSRTDLTETARLMEGQVRYSTLTWLAWYLYQAGHTDEMAKTLKQSWQHSVHLPLETIAYWMDNFAGFAGEWGSDLNMQALTQDRHWQQLLLDLVGSKSLNQ